MKREIKYDFLRVLAIFGVIVIHVTSNSYNHADVHSLSWSMANIYNNLFRWTVPVFFMLSGALLLNKEKFIFKEFIKKYILKNIGLFALFVILYAVVEIGSVEAIFGSEKWNFIFLLFNYKYHLWFLVAIIGLYMLYPIFLALKQYENGKYIGYYCILFFIFSVLYHTLQTINFQGILEYIPTIFSNFNYELVGYSGYFLTGYYLSKMDCSKNKMKLFIALILVFIVTIFISYNYAITYGEINPKYSHYFFISTYLEAIIIFLIFNSIKFQFGEKINRIIVEMSNLTVYVYLIHPFIMDCFFRYYPLEKIKIKTELIFIAISILIFVLCFASAFLIKIGYQKLKQLKKINEFM